MVKECRIWAAVVQKRGEGGAFVRVDAVVCAPDFDTAMRLVRKEWPLGHIEGISQTVYDVLVTGD
jgi:hypothetical protein